MITYMTRKSFLDTALDLDTNLLVALVVDTHDLLREILGMEDETDANGAMYRVWQGHEAALAAYQACLSLELASRGVQNHLHLRVGELIRIVRRKEELEFSHPAWIEDEDVLRSHRSNMARRWPGEYKNQWKGTPSNWPYIFPFADGNGGYELMVSKGDKEALASGTRTLPKDVRERVSNL